MATENVTYLLSVKDVNFEKSIDGATTKLGGLKGLMSAIGPALGVGAIIGGLGKIISVSGDFEASMSNVKALSGATGAEFDALKQQAKDLGEATAFSASQSADAMGFLAMAGFETTEIMSALPGVLDLAAAGSVDLAQAADIASNVLSGYGFQADQIGAVNDVLAKTFSSTNTDLSMLAESFKDLAPIASGMGLQFTEMSAAVGLLGNAGIQGSKSGRALKNALAALAAPTDAMQRKLDELGIKTTNADGSLVDLVSVVQQLEESGASGTDILQIFGKIAGPSMTALVSQGSGALRDLTAELENAGGTAQNIAETKLDNFQGRLTILGSALEGLAINIGELLLPIMSAMVVGITELIGFIQENGDVLAVLAIGMGVYAIAVNAATIATNLWGSASIFAAAKQWLLNIALNANPIGLVVIALTAFVASILWAWNNVEEFRGALYAAWEVMKQIGSNIWDVLVAPLMAVGEIFMGLVDLFSGKGSSRLLDGITNLGKTIIQNLLLPFTSLLELIDEFTGTNWAASIKDTFGIKGLAEGVGEAASTGFEEGVADFNKNKGGEDLDVGGVAPGIGSLESTALGGAAAAGAAGAAGTGDQIKGEVQGAEGSKMTNINITINKLVETLEIRSETLTEGTTAMRDKISEALLTAVNDVNLIS